MGFVIQLLLLVVLLLTVASIEGCENSEVCQRQLKKCEEQELYNGLERYEECLSFLCNVHMCTLCGLCNDNVSHVIHATMAEKLQCLSAHNEFRSYHVDTPSLEWDADLASKAQEYAEKLANKLALHHGATGENMFLKIGSNGTTIRSCIEASGAWYKEIADYDWTTGQSRNKNAIGHFAQVVWQSNRKLGIGIAVHKATKFVYVIGRYATSVMGDTRANVKSLKNPLKQ